MYVIPFCALFWLQRRGGDLPEGVAKKLENVTVLAGHTGCVNRLAWNQDGSLLASASDDCQVRCSAAPGAVHQALPGVLAGISSASAPRLLGVHCRKQAPEPHPAALEAPL